MKHARLWSPGPCKENHSSLIPCNSLNESIAQWKWKRNCKPAGLFPFQIVKVCDVVTPEVTTKGNYHGVRYKAKCKGRSGKKRRNKTQKINPNLKVGQFSSWQKVSSQLPPGMLLDAMLLNILISAPGRGIHDWGEGVGVGKVEVCVEEILKNKTKKLSICHHDDPANSMLTWKIYSDAEDLCSALSE